MFNAWLLVVRGQVRRTGPRGVSLTASGAWDLQLLAELWHEQLDRGATREQALAAVLAVMDEVPEGFGMVGEKVDVEAYADWRTGPEPASADATADGPSPQVHTRAGGMGRRRVLVHASGFQQSPYADVKPAGVSPSQPPRKLWHSSPGSSGR